MRGRQSRGHAGRRKRPSRRTRRSLLLVFALVFSPVATARAACVEFAKPPVISLGADGPRDVSAADVDGDGDLDSLSASLVDDMLAWYENNGGGGGWTVHTISTAVDGASSLSATDVDGDGDLDVFSAALNDGEIAWHENVNGAGTSWNTHIVSTLFTMSSSVFAADMDGDGDADALATDRDSGEIFWFRNNGAGGGWTAQTVSLVSYAGTTAVAADIDGDGDPDIFSASTFLDRVAWHQNYGGGTSWGTQTITLLADAARSVAAIDVDGDGDIDALSASQNDDEVAWYENLLGNGSLWTTHLISTVAFEAWDVGAGDLDGDGDADVLSASRNDGKIAWYENNGLGTAWTAHTITSTAAFAESVVSADLDGDGDLDALLATYNDTIAWLRNDRLHGEALFLPSSVVSTIYNVQSIDTADIDGDGDPDVLSASPFGNTLDWHENSAAGTVWTSQPLSTVAILGLQEVRAADIDHDGHPDALVATDGASGRAAWYENAGDGSGEWAAHAISTSIRNTHSVFAADINGDGDVDVVAGTLSTYHYYQTAIVGWWENDGDGAVWTGHPIVSDVYMASKAVSAADFDGDGHLDVLATTDATDSGSDDWLAWYENAAPNGDGSTWSVHTITTAVVAPEAAVPADLDGDGDVDVLTVYGNSSEIAWYENRPPGSGASWSFHALSTAFSQPLVALWTADVDGDGDLDALSASAYNDTAVWYENNGTVSGWTAHTLVSETPSSFRSTVTADVDGDGRLDVLLADSLYDVRWLRNIGTKVHDDGFDSDGNKACWSSATP